MDETGDNGSGYETTYGAGYGSYDTQSAYEDHTQNQNDLWGAASDASNAGDSYGAYVLTQESQAEGAAATDSWNEHNGYGEYAPTQEATPDTTSGYDTSGGYGADASGGYDTSGGYDADASSSYETASADAGSY